jgi:hypothetical protein
VNIFYIEGHEAGPYSRLIDGRSRQCGCGAWRRDLTRQRISLIDSERTYHGVNCVLRIGPCMPVRAFRCQLDHSKGIWRGTPLA